MPILKDTHRSLIIKLFARFTRPAEIRDTVKEVYKIDVDVKQIVDYNPRGHKGNKLAKKWHVLFEEERRKFVDEDTARDIDIFNKNFRLEELSKIYHKLLNQKNYLGAADILNMVGREFGEKDPRLFPDPETLLPPVTYQQINNIFNMPDEKLDPAKEIKQLK